MNEDTDGDRAALKREIKRLQEELAAARRAQSQAQAVPPPMGAVNVAAAGSNMSGSSCTEPAMSGTPARLADAADAMLAAASPSMGEVRQRSFGSSCDRHWVAVVLVCSAGARLVARRAYQCRFFSCSLHKSYLTCCGSAGWGFMWHSCFCLCRVWADARR